MDHTTLFPRSSGILLHPTSLPGPHGAGDLGPMARVFLDQLQRAGQRWWQMLPLNAPGYGGSPYSAESAFAGNPSLISLDLLEDTFHLFEKGELDALEALGARASSKRCVDVAAVSALKKALLEKASVRFLEKATPQDIEKFEAFKQRHAHWLEDYALYAALKARHADTAQDWRGWPAPLVRRDPDALAAAREELSGAITQVCFEQYVFASQWEALRQEAHARGVQLVGDIPIFVAMDSADVWANKHLFKMDASGKVEVVAGVPPDYFSETGQKWGNPVYDWEANQESGYAWWLRRIAHTLAMVDVIRIDHFRGFQAYWETPESEPTAMHGTWVDGPAGAFFDAIRAHYPEGIPFIAEDLGDIDDDVLALRDAYALPGMKIMHFAFGSEEEDHPFRPHTYPELCVAYTGTHDNDTTKGWYEALSELEKHRVRAYLSSPDADIVEHMIEALFRSRARLVLLPAQDLWELDGAHRMNTPATTDGNWSWRMTLEELHDTARFEALGELTRQTGREVT